jgi:hypothetical protein
VDAVAAEQNGSCGSGAIGEGECYSGVCFGDFGCFSTAGESDVGVIGDGG